MAPVDGIATPGAACGSDPAKACTGHDSVMSLSCTGGRWTADAKCAVNQRCDTASGMTQGTCQPMLSLCMDKQTGDSVCDGFRRRRCGQDLLRFEAQDCPENSHCDSTTAVRCVCDIGFKDDGAGMCVNNVMCPATACKPFGQCVVGPTDYSCECDPEFEGTGTKMCVATGRCAQETVCTGEYTCRSREMSYVCRGQFADWPMPSKVAGAKAVPGYTVTGETVKDAVTGLTWQRNLPEMYAGCTSVCSWEKANAYCEKLELEGARDWRLPTLIELASILDDSRVMPSIDAQAFPNTPPEMFWTSSSVANVTTQAWVLNFNIFQADALPKTNSQRVRCVR